LTTLPPKSNLTSIQTLRGIAALVVALAHLHSVETKFGADALLGNWAIVGFGGVDLFFVISGFVMVWVTRSDQGRLQTIPRFWLARFLRVYPLWWLALSAIVAVWLMRPEWVYSSNQATPDILRSYLLLPAASLPLHAVGWTLIHEVWFYLVFGVILIAPIRFFPYIIGLWALIVVVAALALPSPSSPLLALIRHPLTLEFILGAGVGFVATRRTLPFAKPVLQAGILIIVLCALSIRDNPGAAFADEWTRVAMFGAPCAMILWGAVGLNQLGSTSPKWTQSLGNWSYALYLFHVPVFAAIGRAAAPLSRPGPLDNIAFLIVAVSTAIGVAFMVHILFEKPVQRLAAGLLKRIKPAATSRV
jgi:exopolysaccharide production protein ExoZ